MVVVGEGLGWEGQEGVTVNTELLYCVMVIGVAVTVMGDWLLQLLLMQGLHETIGQGAVVDGGQLGSLMKVVMLFTTVDA